MKIALLGFLPWVDAARNIAVRENPAALTAQACAEELVAEGHAAFFIPVEVSAEGIASAMSRVRELEASVVVALGRTPRGPRVERWGRVPGSWAPERAGESTPWLLAPDAEGLALHLSGLVDAGSETGAFEASDDAGAYFCDHLCVELVRDARERGSTARFLHLTGIDSCSPEVREARLRQYRRQVRAVVDWLCAQRAMVA